MFLSVYQYVGLFICQQVTLFVCLLSIYVRMSVCICCICAFVGWLFTIQLKSADELKTLMDEDKYDIYLKSQAKEWLTKCVICLYLSREWNTLLLCSIWKEKINIDIKPNVLYIFGTYIFICHTQCPTRNINKHWYIKPNVLYIFRTYIFICHTQCPNRNIYTFFSKHFRKNMLCQNWKFMLVKWTKILSKMETIEKSANLNN